MLHRFTDHPHSVGETYVAHACTAAGFGSELIKMGLACLVHAALPWIFEDYASRRVRALNARLSARHPGSHSIGDLVAEGLGV